MVWIGLAVWAVLVVAVAVAALTVRARRRARVRSRVWMMPQDPARSRSPGVRSPSTATGGPRSWWWVSPQWQGCPRCNGQPGCYYCWKRRTGGAVRRRR